MDADEARAGRMTEAVRTELVRAIENDEIENATAFAEDFARRHDLNPTSVRSAISRLRADLGKLKRPTGSGRSSRTGHRDETDLRVSAVTLLKVADATDRRFARVGAAALVRYENDEAFRAAVDRERAAIVRIYQSFTGLRASSVDLLPGERAELLQLFQPDSTGSGR